MNKWLSRIYQREQTNCDTVDIVDQELTLSTTSQYSKCVYTNKPLSIHAKEMELRNLIMQQKSVYGGSNEDWIEYANDVINDWSHDLDSAINCFMLVHEEEQPKLGRSRLEAEFRELIMSLKIFFPDTIDESWPEYADKLIIKYSFCLDKAIECYSEVYKVKQSEINRQNQEEMLV